MIITTIILFKISKYLTRHLNISINNNFDDYYFFILVSLYSQPIIKKNNSFI